MRWLLSLLFALLCSFGLFAIIAWMVGGNPQIKNDRHSSLRFDLVMAEPDEQVVRKRRQLPEPPDPQETPAETLPDLRTEPIPVAAVQAPSAIALPNVHIDKNVTGFAIEAPSLSQTGRLDQQATPISRVPPQYPMKALQRNVEGYVVLSFTIDKNGRPADISVIEAKPEHIFEREALRALRRWKYQPKRINGEAVEQPRQQVTIKFNLEHYEN